MTRLLQEAYSRLAELDETEQNAIAAMILEVLADDEQWAAQFSNSTDALAKLAAEALDEHRAGETHLLDPEAI